jgi:4-carboxymuconolactone decarboxylase
MALVPYPDEANADPRAKEVLERLPVRLNLFTMLANAPSLMRETLRLGEAILTRSELEPDLRELVILHAARLTDTEYEWVQHVPIAEAVGASEEQVAALERDEPEASCFSEPQRLLLRFTTEVVQDARASEEALAGLKQTMSPREIVELLMVIGQYMMIARVMATTDMELDEPAGAAALDAAG